MSLITRRTLLGAAAAAPATRLWAGPAGQPRLLVVFLRGAYDAASVLVPRGSSFYLEARPKLAITDGVGLDGDWALNPVLAPPLLKYWKAGELAFIPFAGSNNLSRSHFETQDVVENGMSDRPGGAASGFMNRLASVVSGAKPLSFTGDLPLSFRGPLKVANLVVQASQKASSNPRRDQMLARMYAKDSQLGDQVLQGFQARTSVAKALEDEMMNSGRGASDLADFEGRARRIATVMRGSINMAFTDIGNWDTHVNQRGGLDFKLSTLGRGLAGFADDMGSEWKNTLVVVISEFGRTMRENGAGGTDHGHGTVFWLMGGAVAGAKIGGRQVQVSRATLNQDRDYPVLNEGRATLGGLFKQLYGLDAARLGRVFPGVQPLSLGLI